MHNPEHSPIPPDCLLFTPYSILPTLHSQPYPYPEPSSRSLSPLTLILVSVMIRTEGRGRMTADKTRKKANGSPRQGIVFPCHYSSAFGI
jgi:hypothetical protein